MKNKIEQKKTCFHELIHTSRLLKEPGSVDYIIEKICADCGLWLGAVEVYK